MNPKHPLGPTMTLGNMRATGLETRSSNEQRVVRSSSLAAEAVKGTPLPGAGLRYVRELQMAAGVPLSLS